MPEEAIHRLSREALHNAVWSEAMRVLAPRFGVSDVALAKACRRASVPVPERGFWAKRKVGARVEIPKLPARPFGLPDEVVIGRGNSWQWNRGLTEAELLGPIPEMPSFSEDLDAVRQRAVAAVGKVSVRASETHPAIQRLLVDDEARREKQRTTPYPIWDKPRFNTPLERRRLKILNRIFTMLQRCGATTTVRDTRYEPISFSVQIGHQQVGFELEPISARGGRGKTEDTKPQRLRFKIKSRNERDGTVWEDDDQAKIEVHLTAIAVELLVSGEIQYREGIRYAHEWRIERKRQIEEQKRREKEEEERRERERQAALQQARVDRREAPVTRSLPRRSLGSFDPTS